MSTVGKREQKTDTGGQGVKEGHRRKRMHRRDRRVGGGAGRGTGGWGSRGGKGGQESLPEGWRGMRAALPAYP